ncbi:MAG: hypothetical protein JO168_01795 [Solirubrobacterales bacterium]|nr:hypothetical protein [Solirubrobacterales bacterium]
MNHAAPWSGNPPHARPDSTSGCDFRNRSNTEFAADHHDSFLKELSPLVRSGDIRYREDIAEGLEAAPGAFIDMLAGRNFGKALIRVS